MIKFNIKGFTLVELMVVIAIIAILGVIGATLFNTAQKSARDSRRRADISALSKAMENHFNTIDSQYCTTSPITTAGNYCPLDPSWFAANSIPVDPVNSTSGSNNYQYTFSVGRTGDPSPTIPNAGFKTYIICALLEGGNGGNSSDINGTAQANGPYYCLRNQQSSQ